MDPVSAMGLASSIITFIDFSWELVAGAGEIYRAPDGTSKEYAQLEDVIEDLKEVTHPLQAHVPENTKADKRIERLARYCQEDSRTLLKLLSALRIDVKRRTVWSSLNAKWRSILKKDEVSQLKSQLQENRAEIQFHITFMLQDGQSAFGVQLKKIEDDCRSLNIGIPRQLHQLRDELIKTMNGEKSSNSTEPRIESCPLSSIKQQLQDIQSLLAAIPPQHRILRQLIFDDMESRRDHILDANPDTCRWILEDDPGPEVSESASGASNDSVAESASTFRLDSGSDDSWSDVDSEDVEWDIESIHRRETRNNFIAWLATGQDVLHVSGNAGSGKSTLMKFIGQHERTRRELEAWAGPKRLVFGQFYFWAAGTESQRTLPGLYRSLLFQTLSQSPELIEKVFPTQLARMRSSGFQDDQKIERLQGFSDAHVRDAFDLLLQQTKHEHHRICFLLDGLDEFEGNRLDHENLAIRLKAWTVEGDVKLLVSSRPWPEFLNIFLAKPTIHLHKLNRFDIKTYCSSRLAEDREIRCLGSENVAHELEDVMESIVAHSQGIFLWAHLVLVAILQGVRQGDSVTTLKGKVEEYPVDLDSLYTKLREPIAKSVSDMTTSNRMLLLAAKKPDGFRLTAVAVSWVLDGGEAGLLDAEYPTETECRPYSEDEVTRRLERVTKQINGLTRGLLEIVQITERDFSGGRFAPGAGVLSAPFRPYEIQFSHKSARDYLVLDKTRYQKMRASWPDFDDTDVYGRIHLAQLVYGVRFDSVLQLQAQPREIELYLAQPYCRDFDFRTIRKFEMPIRPLLRGRIDDLIYSARPVESDVAFLQIRPLLRGRIDDLIYSARPVESDVAFLQWCAWCGLYRFVLSEVSEPHRKVHSPGSSILFAINQSLDGESILLQLLDRRIGVDIMVEAWAFDKSGGTFVVPAWVLLFCEHLDAFKRRICAILGFRDRTKELTHLANAVAVLRCIHQYSGQVGHRLSLALVLRLESWSEPVHPVHSREFSSAEIVEWCEGMAEDARKILLTSNSSDRDLDQSPINAPTGDDETDGEPQQKVAEWVQEIFNSGDEGDWYDIYSRLHTGGLRWNSIYMDFRGWGRLCYRVL